MGISGFEILSVRFFLFYLIQSVEVAGSNINNAATAEMNKQKLAYSEKVIEPNVRSRISRVVASINKLK